MNNDDAPATKGDLEVLKVEFRAELKTELAALDQRWEGKLDVREQRMLDSVRGMIHDSETRLLQAFYGFAEANNKRLNQMDGNIAIFLNRLGTVEERLLRVEKRLDIPPGT